MENLIKEFGRTLSNALRDLFVGAKRVSQYGKGRLLKLLSWTGLYICTGFILGICMETFSHKLAFAVMMLAGFLLSITGIAVAIQLGFIGGAGAIIEPVLREGADLVREVAPGDQEPLSSIDGWAITDKLVSIACAVYGTVGIMMQIITLTALHENGKLLIIFITASANLVLLIYPARGLGVWLKRTHRLAIIFQVGIVIGILLQVITQGRLFGWYLNSARWSWVGRSLDNDYVWLLTQMLSIFLLLFSVYRITWAEEGKTVNIDTVAKAIRVLLAIAAPASLLFMSRSWLIPAWFGGIQRLDVPAVAIVATSLSLGWWIFKGGKWPGIILTISALAAWRLMLR